MGILPQQRTQRGRERETDGLPHGNLRYAHEFILDRVLDGKNLLASRPNVVDRGVQRRRLARARRSGSQDNAMRSPNNVFETAPRLLTHSQSVERHALLVLIQ